MDEKRERGRSSCELLCDGNCCCDKTVCWTNNYRSIHAQRTNDPKFGTDGNSWPLTPVSFALESWDLLSLGVQACFAPHQPPGRFTAWFHLIWPWHEVSGHFFVCFLPVSSLGFAQMDPSRGHVVASCLLLVNVICFAHPRACSKSWLSLAWSTA